MPTDIAEARDELFRAWVRESPRVRAPLRRAAEAINRQITAAKMMEDGSRMLPGKAAELERVIQREMSRAFQGVHAEIRQGILNSMERSAEAQLSNLTGKGLRALPDVEVRRIQQDVLKMLNDKYPPGTLNYYERMQLMQHRHERQLVDVVGRRHYSGEGLSRIRLNVETALLHNDGATPLEGGSVSHQSRRLMISEEARLSTEIEKRVARASGVELGYWTLSSDHKWEGGGESCEILAASTGDSVNDYVLKIPFDRRPAVLSGMYSLDEWPAHPHPFCKCHMEPFVA